MQKLCNLKKNNFCDLFQEVALNKSKELIPNFKKSTQTLYTLLYNLWNERLKLHNDKTKTWDIIIGGLFYFPTVKDNSSDSRLSANPLTVVTTK